MPATAAAAAADAAEAVAPSANDEKNHTASEFVAMETLKSIVQCYTDHGLTIAIQHYVRRVFGKVCCATAVWRGRV